MSVLRSWIRACVLASSLIVATAAGAEEESWELTEVIARGEPLPGGGSLTEVGDVYPLKGAYAFWARFGDKQWALYLANDSGTLRLIQDRTDVKLDGQSEPVRIQYHSGGKYIPTEKMFSSGTLYLESRTGLFDFAALSVTTAGIRKILGRGDAAPHPEGAIVKSAKPLATDGGSLLVHYATEKPNEGNHWAIWDGQSFRHVLSAGDEVLPGVRVRALYGSRWYMTHPIPILVGDQIVADLEVESGSYPRAIFAIGPGGVRKLLAVGEVLPENASRKIQSFRSFAAAGPDRFLVQLDSIGEGFMSLEVSSFYLYDHGKLRRVMTWEELNKDLGSLQHVTWSVHFLGDATILQIRPWLKGKAGSFYEIEFPCYLVDLEKTRKIETSTSCGEPKFTWRTSTPSGGHGLIAGNDAEGYRWLDANAPEKMQVPPKFTTDKGDVSLEQIKAWLVPGKGVVVRDGSIYLMERTADLGANP